jgi:hypothetical protein
MLNEQQQLALEACLKAYKNKERTFGLLGGGGTGKTFTASSIIRELKNQALGLGRSNGVLKVMLIAPTGSALKSLKKVFADSDTGAKLEFKTLHSALKKQPDITDDGKMVFSGSSSQDDFSECGVIFIDESSMVGKDLGEELLKIVEATNSFLIICGDKYQHFPVHEESSLLIDVALEGCHQELTQVMRQSGEILPKIIKECRQAVIKKEYGYDPRWNYPETVTETVGDKTLGYYVMDGNVMRQMWRAFSKAYQENDFNFCKIIAARNKTVDRLNDELRVTLWGEDAEEYVLNELLLIKRPVTTKVLNPYTSKYVDVILLTTGSEVLVKDKRKKLYTFLGEMDKTTKKLKEHLFVGWELKVEEIDTGIVATIDVLSRDAVTDYEGYTDYKDYISYEDLLLKYKTKAQKKVKEAKEKNQSAKGYWGDYYKLVDFFTEVKYGYACTSFYVQGKTYSNTFVYADDVASLSNVESKNRTFYVSLTRAKWITILF